jgi:hypothetical protein
MSKLKEEGFQYLSHPMPCWHIDDETHSLVGVDIQKPLWLEQKTCSSRINHDKDYPSFKSLLL